MTRALWRQITGGVAAGLLFSSPMWMPLPARSEPAPQPAAETTRPPDIATTTAPVGTQPYGYVGEWKGQLAVFFPGSDVPAEVYEVFIASLPPEEQARLRERIPADDETALARLLEDYTS